MKFTFLIAIGLLTLQGLAQQADTNYIKSTEFGFGTAGFNNLFLSVKMGTKKGWFLKVQTNEIAYNKTHVDTSYLDSHTISTAFGFRAGIEKRKWINSNFQVGIGIDYYLNKNITKYGTKLNTYNPASLSSSKQQFKAANKLTQRYWGFAIPISIYYTLAQQKLQLWFEYAPFMKFSRYQYEEFDPNGTSTFDYKFKGSNYTLVNPEALRIGIAYRFWKK